MTDQELQGIAYQALNMAKKDIARKKGFGAVLATYFESEGLRRMTKIETFIRKIAGPDWLDNWRAKDVVFDILRMGTNAIQPDAFVFVTAANMFRSTDKLMALDPNEQERLINAGHDEHHRMVARGLLTIEDTLVAIAQNPQRACIVKQVVGPDGEFLGAPATHYMDQSKFDGRMKIFGEGKFR